MHKLESGKQDFLNLLQEVPKVIGAEAHKVTAVGFVLAPVNGALSLCINFGDTIDELAETKASDFACPHVLQFGEDSKPLCYWTEEYWNDGELVLEDDLSLKDWVSDSDFAEPIMDRVCHWIDEFFRSSENEFLQPLWLVVDEIDSGSNRYWRPGKLNEAKS